MINRFFGVSLGLTAAFIGVSLLAEDAEPFPSAASSADAPLGVNVPSQTADSQRTSAGQNPAHDERAGLGTDLASSRRAPFGQFSLLGIRWTLGLKASVSAFYDDNIFIQPENKEEDFIFTLAPNVSLTAGDFRYKENDYFSVDYTARGSLFVDHTSENSLEHDLGLELQLRWSKLVAGLRYRYQYMAGADVETGTRSNRQVSETAFTVKYEISDKTSVEADFYNTIYDYETQLD